LVTSPHGLTVDEMLSEFIRSFTFGVEATHRAPSQRLCGSDGHSARCR
jgi:hypothetical protein